jgi:hexosaminidase
MDYELPLLPRPREIKFTGGEVSLAGLAVVEIIRNDGPRESGEEAYRLVITPESVQLIARTEIGLCWARATLAQLRSLGRVPALEIEDAPRFVHRGLMLDISRDRVPTLRTLFDLVDKMAAWKLNHLQLYVEHTIAYAGHEDVWCDASALTFEEIDALDAYCTHRGIALTANQNCLGHFERWLKHPRYAGLGEVDSPGMARGENFVLPNTLCPIDPKSLILIKDLLGQLAPHCSGNYFNIGCDEPWDLGRGRSREACERDGRGRVFSDYVSAVAEEVRRLGKRPQFWCDPHPNEDGNRLGDVVALIWGYDGSEPFTERAEAHRAAGREIWVAPGTSCWNSTTGRTWNRRQNLDHAASIEATGFLCTAWGDGGHRQPWPLTLFGFADAAMAAWSGPGHFDNAAIGRHVFGCDELGGWLAELGNVDEELCRGERPDFQGKAGSSAKIHNKTALWQEMNTPLHEPKGVGDITAWEEVAARLKGLRQSLPELVDPLVRRELLHGLEVAAWTCDRAILRRSSEMSLADRKALALRMCDILAEHRSLWLARSRPGGLNDSLARYATLAANY